MKIEQEEKALLSGTTQPMVYIKRLDTETATSMVGPNALADVADPDELFAVFGENGQALAIVEGRDAAFEAARQHKLLPSSVH